MDWDVLKLADRFVYALHMRYDMNVRSLPERTWNRPIWGRPLGSKQVHVMAHAQYVFIDVESDVRTSHFTYRKASFRGAPSAHPDWIVPSVDEEVEMKFQRTIEIYTTIKTKDVCHVYAGHLPIDGSASYFTQS